MMPAPRALFLFVHLLHFFCGPHRPLLLLLSLCLSPSLINPTLSLTLSAQWTWDSRGHGRRSCAYRGWNRSRQDCAGMRLCGHCLGWRSDALSLSFNVFLALVSFFLFCSPLSLPPFITLTHTHTHTLSCSLPFSPPFVLSNISLPLLLLALRPPLLPQPVLTSPVSRKKASLRKTRAMR